MARTSNVTHRTRRLSLASGRVPCLGAPPRFPQTATCISTLALPPRAERMGIVFQALRFARVCLEESFLWAHSRQTFGKKLIEHPVIRAKLAEMARQVEATQAMTELLTYQLKTIPREHVRARSICQPERTSRRAPREQPHQAAAPPAVVSRSSRPLRGHAGRFPRRR